MMLWSVSIQVIVGIGKESRTLAGRRPLAGRVGMGGELGLDLGGGPESLMIQNLQIFPDGPRRSGGIDSLRVPLPLRGRVLPVGIGFDQAGVDRQALPAYQPLLDAPCDDGSNR